MADTGGLRSAKELDHEVKLDLDRSLAEARDGGHNRWHPAISPLVRARPGELIAMDVRDSSDVQVVGDSHRDTQAGTDLDRIHPLTGPIYVDGAEPGDLLDVEIVDLSVGTWGWSGIYPGGGGVMRDAVSEPEVVIWQFAGGYARSEQLPGVAIPASPFIGVIGVAPSEERLRAIIAREARVVEQSGEAFLPQGRFAFPDSPQIAAEGLRTIAAREIGGNLDVRDIGAGSRFLTLVDVPGALLSLGDCHFAQGDGESFGTAIETKAHVCLRCHLHKSRDLNWRPRFPLVKVDRPMQGRHPGPVLMTTGMPLDAHGEIGFHDVTLATQNALMELVDYLVHARGLTRNQAFTLVSVAGDLRISVIVNPPSPVVSVTLPIRVLELEERWWR
ncbi:MAG: acetamidase/formamidase family protein [Solirubrobacteraceae bacterium]